MVAQATSDFRNSTILVYISICGKGSNWLWSTWEQSWFCSLLTGQSIIVGLLVVFKYIFFAHVTSYLFSCFGIL